MNPTEIYTLIRDVHPVNPYGRERDFLPRQLYIDHYKSLDLPFLMLVTTPINRLDPNHPNLTYHYLAGAKILRGYDKLMELQTTAFPKNHTPEELRLLPNAGFILNANGNTSLLSETLQNFIKQYRRDPQTTDTYPLAYYSKDGASLRVANEWMQSNFKMFETRESSRFEGMYHLHTHYQALQGFSGGKDNGIIIKENFISEPLADSIKRLLSTDLREVDPFLVNAHNQSRLIVSTMIRHTDTHEPCVELLAVNTTHPDKFQRPGIYLYLHDQLPRTEAMKAIPELSTLDIYKDRAFLLATYTEDKKNIEPTSDFSKLKERLGIETIEQKPRAQKRTAKELKPHTRKKGKSNS